MWNLPSFLMLPFVLVFISRYVVVFYRRTIRMSVYDYLEQRFNYTARAYGAAAFIVSRVVDMSATLYFLAIPVSFLSGIDVGAVDLRHRRLARAAGRTADRLPRAPQVARDLTQAKHRTREMRFHVVAAAHPASPQFERSHTEYGDQPADAGRAGGCLQLATAIRVARQRRPLDQCHGKLTVALDLELFEGLRQRIGQSRLPIDGVARHFQLNAVLLLGSHGGCIDFLHASVQELFFRPIEFDLPPQLRHAALCFASWMVASNSRCRARSKARRAMAFSFVDQRRSRIFE